MHLATNADGVSNIMNPGLFLGLPKVQEVKKTPNLVLSFMNNRDLGFCNKKPSLNALKEAAYFGNELSDKNQVEL